MGRLLVDVASCGEQQILEFLAEDRVGQWCIVCIHADEWRGARGGRRSVVEAPFNRPRGAYCVVEGWEENFQLSLSELNCFGHGEH